MKMKKLRLIQSSKALLKTARNKSHFSQSKMIILVANNSPVLRSIKQLLFFLFIFMIIILNYSDMLNLESIIKSFPNIEEIKDILHELFDNKLYSNTLNGDVGGNEVTTNTGNVNGESSEVVPNNHNETGDADSFRGGRDFPECSHTTPEDCNCPHEQAFSTWKISEHNDRCHSCSDTGSTTLCLQCNCLFHPGCLPEYCEIQEKPEYETSAGEPD